MKNCLSFFSWNGIFHLAYKHQSIIFLSNNVFFFGNVWEMVSYINNLWLISEETKCGLRSKSLSFTVPELLFIKKCRIYLMGVKVLVSCKNT